MSGESVRPLARFAAPFGKEVEMLDVTMDNNVRLLRLRIREGRRFTMMDLDPVTAKTWGEQMLAWSASYHEDEEAAER